MLKTVALLFSDVLLVADQGQEQRAKTALPRLWLGKKDKLSNTSPGTAYFEAKDKHYLYTRHKNTMKRLVKNKIMFQRQSK